MSFDGSVIDVDRSKHYRENHLIYVFL